MSGDFGDYYMASITRDGMGYMQIETPLALADPVLASITRDGVHADRDTTGVGPSGCTLSGLGSKWTMGLRRYQWDGAGWRRRRKFRMELMERTENGALRLATQFDVLWWKYREIS